ncbi:MAG TPA: hypothetical protein VLG12_06735 [Candidatus Saccharimonadales bacterium]|nr:hypothetical protein [Candidatus Saccharimonadales bacterium]
MSTFFGFLQFISFLCLVIGLIKPKIFTFLFKTVPSRKRIGTVFGISTFVLMILVSATSLKTKDAGSNTPTQSAIESSTPTPTIDTTKGLNITRDAAISAFKDIDPSINFQPSTSVNGIDRYMATAGQGAIELYGKEDNLTEIASTALFGNTAADHAGNVAELVYIIGAANIVDPAGKSWVTTSLEGVITAWQNGQTSVKKSTIINGKKYDISALKSDSIDSIGLTIYSATESTPPTESKTSSLSPLNDPKAYPGMTKVKLNASLVTNTQGMIFTNNENKNWQYCIATINPEDGASEWYEYDFGNIASHQSYNLIPWNKLTKEDNTTFDHATMKSKTIELSCELGTKTVGLADFTGR